jgi:hypothetical protein
MRERVVMRESSDEMMVTRTAPMTYMVTFPGTRGVTGLTVTLEPDADALVVDVAVAARSNGRDVFPLRSRHGVPTRYTVTCVVPVVRMLMKFHPELDGYRVELLGYNDHVGPDEHR